MPTLFTRLPTSAHLSYWVERGPMGLSPEKKSFQVSIHFWEPKCVNLILDYMIHNKGGKFLKKLWYCIGREYYKRECICSCKGLTLEMSPSESIYSGQSTSSTQLIKPNYLIQSLAC